MSMQYVNVHTCMYMYMYKYKHMYMHMHVHVYTHRTTHTYVYVSTAVKDAAHHFFIAAEERYRSLQQKLQQKGYRNGTD